MWVCRVKIMTLAQRLNAGGDHCQGGSFEGEVAVRLMSQGMCLVSRAGKRSHDWEYSANRTTLINV